MPTVVPNLGCDPSRRLGSEYPVVPGMVPVSSVGVQGEHLWEDHRTSLQLRILCEPWRDKGLGSYVRILDARRCLCVKLSCQGSQGVKLRENRSEVAAERS